MAVLSSSHAQCRDISVSVHKCIFKKTCRKLNDFDCAIEVMRYVVHNTSSDRVTTVLLLFALLTVAPEITLPNRRIGQSVGRQTILECRITAYPQAVSYWEMGGRTVTSSNKHKIEAYEIGHTVTLSLRLTISVFLDCFIQ